MLCFVLISSVLLNLLCIWILYMTHSVLCRKLGAKIELLSKEQLAAKFPWLNTTGIEVGSLGEWWLQNLVHCCRQNLVHCCVQNLVHCCRRNLVHCCMQNLVYYCRQNLFIVLGKTWFIDLGKTWFIDLAFSQNKVRYFRQNLVHCFSL